MSETEAVPTLAERLRRGDLFEPACPSREVMRHVTSSWGVLILIALLDGTMRFSELRRRVAGVSERMLAQTLRWLEEDRLVARRSYPVVPPRTDYTLTPLGREAAGKVAALAEWIEANLPRIMAARASDDRPAPRPPVLPTALPGRRPAPTPARR